MGFYIHHFTDPGESRLFDPLVQALMIELGLCPCDADGNVVFPNDPGELRKVKRRWRKLRRKLADQIWHSKARARYANRMQLREMFVAACQYTLKQRLVELGSKLPAVQEQGWRMPLPAMKDNELPPQILQAVDKILSRYGTIGDEDGRRQDPHAGRYPRGAHYERATEARGRRRAR